jgi:ubiquitin-protein ligase
MSHQVLTQELSEILATHCSQSQSRRINKDLEYLIEEYPNVRVEFDYKLNIPIVIVIVGENEIKMKIKNNFPLKPPEIELNSQPYINILVFDSNIKHKLLKEIAGVDCLCCESLLCESIWFAQSKLKDIVNEVCKNIEIIHNINNYVNNTNIIEDDNITDDNITDDNITDDNKNKKLLH